MVSRVNWSSFRHLRYLMVRILGFGNTKIGFNCKKWVFHTVHGVIVMSAFLFLVLALGLGYSYLFPGVQPVVRENEIQNSTNSTSECNFFDGKWVYDESVYPLYNSSECPFTERGFNCLANGRKGKDYLKWRWKPKNCDILRFNVDAILENLRGKRVVFVGDSLGRTQWESMICLLITGVVDKRSVYEVNGNKITKQIRHLAVRFSSFNLRVEFYRSVFLVQPSSVPKRAPKRIKSTLELDKLDDISKEWIDSDILVFNTGHWWTPTKLFDMGRYFQIGGKMRLGMSMNNGYRTALATWASWVENKVNTNRTHIFFRTFEPSHWRKRSMEILSKENEEAKGGVFGNNSVNNALLETTQSTT
ncbi:hypothetical protein LguiB_017692 [Lonicera macranthoides]